MGNQAPDCVVKRFGPSAIAFEDGWCVACDPWRRRADILAWRTEFSGEGWTLVGGGCDTTSGTLAGLFAFPTMSGDAIARRFRVGAHNASSPDARVERVARFLANVAERIGFQVVLADEASLSATFDDQPDPAAAAWLAGRVGSVCPEAASKTRDIVERAGFNIEQMVADAIERLEEEGADLDELYELQPHPDVLAAELCLTKLRRLEMWWD